MFAFVEGFREVIWGHRGGSWKTVRDVFWNYVEGICRYEWGGVQEVQVVKSSNLIMLVTCF